jgi:predicted lipoprotein with Yx(FWY)xxD motif/uncharacterized cupredoxin-like copper-binding protein
MKRRLVLIVPLLLALAFTWTAAQGEPTVSTAESDELGTYLTDAEGMTLYLFTNDEPGKSNCSGDCATNWPPFTAEEPLSLPEGVPGELTLIARDDGSSQVAYNGWPLYYWVNDAAPGDTTGHEVGDVWFVVNPAESAEEMVIPGMATPVASPMASPAAGQAVDVEIGDYFIEPSATTFTVGETYTFVITNTSAQTIHEFVIEPAGSTEEAALENEQTGDHAEVEDIAAGDTAELTWTFTEAGDFQFACHIEGHFEEGMVVAVTVEE